MLYGCIVLVSDDLMASGRGGDNAASHFFKDTKRYYTMKCFRSLLVLLAAFNAAALAQTATSVIFGTLTDTSNALFPTYRSPQS